MKATRTRADLPADVRAIIQEMTIKILIPVIANRPRNTEFTGALRETRHQKRIPKTLASAEISPAMRGIIATAAKDIFGSVVHKLASRNETTPVSSIVSENHPSALAL